MSAAGGAEPGSGGAADTGETQDEDPGAGRSREPRLAALVLAAGTASRFGGGKVRALLGGRPLLAYVLAAARAAGAERTVVVLGRDAEDVRSALLADDAAAFRGVLIAVNPAPERGLASSLRLGLAAAAHPSPAGGSVAAGVLVLLGDQPRVRPDVIRALVEAAAAASPDTIAVVPAYAADGAPNPVLLLRAGLALGRDAEGDRGLGPLLAAAPGRVVRVAVAGSNPDVDTPADLAALEETMR